MLTSLELRWFFVGRLPQEILSWFQNHDLGGELQPSQAREDSYLCLPKIEYLGIKIRQERLEIKWRKAQLGVQQFGQIEGKVEKWSKWSEKSTKNFQLADFEGRWVSVKKKRSQRCYQVDHGELVTNATATQQPTNQGCNLEITELNIREQGWWTIGFEAFGEENCLRNNLQAVVSHIGKNYPGCQLQAQNSYAYPSWIYLIS